MSSENENEQGLDEERDDSSSRDDADTRLPDLSDFKNVDKSNDFDNDVDAAVRASADHEAAKRKSEAARRRNSDNAEEDSSSPTERRVRQDVLAPSTSNYGPGVALPAYRDGPQLVGVTVSTAGADTPEAVGVTELGVILKRNFRTIVLIIFLIIALSALALAFVTPRYSASTDILFGSDVTANRGSNDVLSGVRDDEASMQSQVSLLTSSDLALRVIRKMGLKENPEFSADPDTSDQAIGGGVSVATMETLEKYGKRLAVEHVPGTRVVSLRFSAADPAVASGTANALAELYIQDQRDSKFDAISDAAGWLTAQVSELRRQVAESELEIEKFKLDSGMIERGGMTLGDRELSSLNAQLIESRAQTTEAQTRLREIRGLLATPDGIDSAAEVLDSNLIQRLREQESTLLANMAELGTELGDKHPRLLQMQAEVRQVREKIGQETAKIVNALEYRYNIARARERAIVSSLSSATGRLEVGADDMVRLNVMEREAAADLLLLETMLGQLKQVSSQVDVSFQEPDARIISRALTPVEPSFPKTGSMLALAGLGSALLAVMFVLMREFADRTIRAEHELAEKINVLPFGIMPKLTPRTLRGLTAFQYTVEKPRSQYAEAARAMAQKIQSTGLDTDERLIMTTSSTHGEGKSTVALALANALSLQGHTVMLIDADHFTPRLHENIGLPAAPGLIEVLDRTVSIKDAVYAAKTNKTFAFMPIGDRSLLSDGGPNFAELRETLTIFREHFDYIIVDAPPVVTSGDALILAGMVDATVLAMRWGKTHRRTAKNCAEKVVQSGCPRVGGVITDVDMKKYELYEFGHSGNYAPATGPRYAS